MTTVNAFVDKSMLIKEVLTEDQNRVLIKRPRRWGKTLNMLMLYYFFNREVDYKGVPLEPQPHRVFFEGGIVTLQGGQAKQLKRLLISQDPEWQKRYSFFQGAFIVIYMSFCDIKCNSFIEVKRQIMLQILRLYHKHSYMQDQRFQQLQSQLKKATTNKQFIRFMDIAYYFVNLMQFLHAHRNRKLIVLIDEFDAPCRHMLEKQLDKQQRFKLQTQINNFIGAGFRGATYVYKRILTGAIDTLDLGYHSSLTIMKFGIEKKQYSRSYGFSLQEIKEQLISEIFDQNGVKEQLAAEIDKWYDVYNVLTQESHTKMCNPYTVISYLSRCFRKNKVKEGQSF